MVGAAPAPAAVFVNGQCRLLVVAAHIMTINLTIRDLAFSTTSMEENKT